MVNRKLGSLLALALLGLAACGEEATADSPELAGDDDQVLQQATSPNVVVPDKNGIYIDRFRADGSGCPPGSWLPEISSNGLSVTVYFDKYRIEPKGADFKTLNCSLIFEMKSPRGVSFGLTSIDYMGTAVLEEGQSATQSATYTFLGAIGSSVRVEENSLRESVHELTGPFDNGYSFRDNVTTTDVAFSECGRPSALVVNTRLSLLNPKRLNEGLILLGFVNANQRTGLVIRLATRTCPQ